eukprot:4062145-Karenia_brevis.AAC.1
MSVQKIREYADQLGPPPSDLTRQGALQELLAKTDYSGQKQGAVVDIKLDSIALPPIGFLPSSIEEIA